jgi:NAD(P)-dependent dehydrogenase (short-subunit alcohol dehydrogenase family)
MISRKSGSIVNISSGMAESDQPHSIIYTVSKAALNKMMLKLAAETTEHNIAVNLLYPPMVRLERMVAMMSADMMDRLPPPSVVGPPAVWLAAQDATRFTGKIVQVNTFGSEWP